MKVPRVGYHQYLAGRWLLFVLWSNMEIIKVQLARSVWLFDTQELNPRGLRLFPEIYSALYRRYSFSSIPKPEEIQAGGSLYFKQGRFLDPQSGVSVEIELELHGDGLVSNCRHSTEAADAFLKDSLEWLGDKLQARYHSSVGKKRVYRSELIVAMSPRMDAVNATLEPLAASLFSLTRKPTTITGLTLGSEGSNATFVIERRANTTFEEDHYFSAASLPTAQHLDVLTRFDELV